MRVVFGVALLACLVAVSNAHTVVKNVTIGGVTTTSCLRPAYQGYDSVNGIGADTPIMSSTGLRDGLMSQNYTCGFMPFAAQAAASSCSIAAGATIGVSYWHGAGYGSETPQKDMWIASSHRGPFLAYMASWNQASGIPTDARWFKIYHAGITKTSSDYNLREWASPDILNKNGGRFTFTIPSDIPAGRYLLRTEIIALHDTSARGAQPYVRCIDLTVTGGGSANPTPKVALPGAISYTDPGLTFNVYTSNNNYPIPGPPVYTPSTVPSTTGVAPPATTGVAPPVTTGRVPPATTGTGNADIGNCLTKDNTRKGCSNQCVSDCVCDVDPYCCRYNWDPWCVREVTRFGCATECNVIVNQEIPDDTSYVRNENSATVAGASVALGVVAAIAALL